MICILFLLIYYLYSKYLKREKFISDVTLPIYNSIKNNSNNNKLNILKKELSKINNLSDQKIEDLVTPYKKITDKDQKWGIFSSLDLDHAINQLYFKREMNYLEAYNDGTFPLQINNIEKPLFTKNQIKSIENYKNKKDIIKRILQKIKNLTPLIEFCKENVYTFINNQIKEINFNNMNESNLNKINYNQLINISNIIENIPLNICDIVETLNKIEKIKNINSKKYEKCLGSLKYFIDYQKKINRINPNLIQNYSMSELKTIYKIMFYLNFSKKSCGDLQNNDDNFFANLSKEYKNKLINDINKQKNTQSNCNIEKNNYIKNKLDEKKIPKIYFKSNLDKYTEENLEMINEIYQDMPECNNFIKNDIINKIIDVDAYIMSHGGHSFGCKDNIIKFRELEFKKRKLYLPLPKNKIDYKKYNINELKQILKLYEDTPTCYTIYNNRITNFDDRISKYLNTISIIKNDDFNLINKKIDKSNNIIDLNYHPYYRHKNIKTKDINLINQVNNNDNKLDLEHKNFTFENILDESYLNNQYNSNLFKDKENKILNIENVKNKINKLEKKLNNCCNKNGNNNIQQQYIKGYTSTFKPEIVIETDKNDLKMN